MRAAWQEQYGSPEMVRVRDVRKPKAGRGEVLVEVRAASLHFGDCLLSRGTPWPVRLASGVLRPSWGVPGQDFAGIDVETGEAVFGMGRGSCAEYVVAKRKHIAVKPAWLSWEQAAALPNSGLAALAAVREVAQLRMGQKLLVIGAAGALGGFAVQLGKWMGAEVTAVCSGKNAGYVKGLGADRVVDYETEDFVAACRGEFDAVLDNIENRSVEECRATLRPGGMLILNSGRGAGQRGFYRRMLRPLFGDGSLRRYLVEARTEDLTLLAGLVERWGLRVPIEIETELIGVSLALRHIETGHSRGKVVVRVRGI